MLLSTGIAAGNTHTCAITAGAGVKCWGQNADGQLGDGTTQSRLTPVDVGGISAGVAAIAAGNRHTCALTTTGAAKCWGNNAVGNLGDGTTTNSLSQVDVVGLNGTAVAISAGQFHTCALTSAGGVKCWGNNANGQLGDGTTATRLTPVDVLTAPGGAPLMGVVAIAAGTTGDYTCVLNSVGGIKCWGSNRFGQLGDGTTVDKFTPVNVSGLTTGAAGVAAGRFHTCAVTTAGGAKCWGRNVEGALGDGSTKARLTPVNVFGLTSGVALVSAGGFHSGAITTAGAVKTWGNDTDSQLGDGKICTGHRVCKSTTPVNVVGLDGTTVAVTALAAGGFHTCAGTATGGIKCWGDNTYGELGDGTTITRAAPVDVVGFGGGAIAAAAAVRQSSPTVTGRHTRAANSTVTIPSHDDAGHHTARTQAADQAIASLLGSATRRRFDPLHTLDWEDDLLADLAAGR